MTSPYPGGVTPQQPSVIVVGAGVAGLTAARELVLLGHEVRVIEAADRVGGQLEGASLDGLTVDLGVDRFAPTEQLREQLDRLGLTDRVIAAEPGRVGLRTGEGQILPLPEPNWLGIPLAPLAAEVVALIGRGGAWRAQLDALLPGPIGTRTASLGALVRRRSGDALLERLVAPVVRSQRGVHPDALPLSEVDGLTHHVLRENSLGRAVARVRLEGVVAGQLDGPIASLEGGAAGLVAALLAEMERFGVPIEYGTRVVAVAPDQVVLADAEGAGPESLPSRGHGDGGGDGERDGPNPTLVRHGAVLIAAPGLLPTEVAGDPSSGARTTVAVLVVEAAALHGAFAGAVDAPALGVIAAEPAPGTPVRVEIVSALWGPLGRAAADRAVLRVVYQDAAAEHPVDAEQARLDAQTLLGASIPAAARHREFGATRRWLRCAVCRAARGRRAGGRPRPRAHHGARPRDRAGILGQPQRRRLARERRREDRSTPAKVTGLRWNRWTRPSHHGCAA